MLGGGGGDSSDTVGSWGVSVRESSLGNRARCFVNFPQLNRTQSNYILMINVYSICMLH